MKNLNVTFVAIIIALFALTSCEKESMQEMETMTQVSQESLSTESSSVVFEDAKIKAFNIDLGQAVQSRNRGSKGINCGFNYNGCTMGQGNSLNHQYYPSDVAGIASYNGEDEYFILEVASTPGMTMIYDFALSGLSANLDLFVFELERTLSGSYRIAETKGKSTNNYARSESIKVSGLSPGVYIVVVDAPQRGIGSHYNLTMECSAVGEPPVPGDEIARIITDFGQFDSIGNGKWGFQAIDSDELGIYEETSRDANNIELENVTETVDVVTITGVYLILDTKKAIQSITKIEEFTSSKSTFGNIFSIEYGN